ncbi:thiamin pyrophosphokinase 2 [Pristis pectinata]|uniref:thiamin pyrophosphokinase 2 n=1 Tax=Pristis pectinata TaxID=685728 RepID=UPI00223DEBB4|nr:thiamin pyrophosphokinase 2 [Pristis pectinata]
MSWAAAVLQLLRGMNSFHTQGSSKASCKPFHVCGQAVGVVPPRVTALLPRHPDVFQLSECEPVQLCAGMSTYEERSHALRRVLDQWRQLELFDCLRGWRDENYEVMPRFCDPPLMHVERSAASLFGIKTYGVHVNGYVRLEDGGLAMWIGRRAHSKQTFPGMLDNLAAGGLSAGLGVKETAVKECAEEASIPECVAAMAVPAGSVSYTYEDERGIFPECQFVYDLELPADLVPRVGDGEMSGFYLWPLEQVREAIAGSEFKPNCAMVALDFLIRHGVVHADSEPYYQQLVEGLHREL